MSTSPGPALLFSMRRVVAVSSLTLLVLACWPLAGHSEENAAGEGKDAAESKTLLLPVTSDKSPWELDFIPYVWAPSLEGTASVLGQTISIDLPVDKVIRDLHVAGFGEVDLRYQRVTFALEGFYARVGLHVVPPENPLLTRIGAGVGIGTVDGSIAYRPLDSRLGYLDLVLGARSLFLDVDLHLTPGPVGKSLITQRDLSGDEETIDPYFGVRGRLNFSRRYYGALRLDYGSFGVGSRVDMLAYGGFGVQWSQHLGSELGFRYSTLDYRHDTFRYDVDTFGGLFKMIFKF